tara:strand:+ start:1289 stop:1987 length:699 start_codon:yes stop_codon:yes gene_type:complete
MATPGATLGDRITDLIGSDYATVPSLSYKDLINSAYNEIVDLIYPEILIKYSRTPGVLTENSEWLVEDRKILLVTRVDADSNGVERQCTLLDRKQFEQSKDSGSIYSATAFSPVFTYDSGNAGASTLTVFPVPTADQKARIFYFNYADNSTDLSGVTSATLNTSYYLPGTLLHAIALKSSICILNAYISNFVQDDEDMELQQMIEKQIMSLTNMYTMEMARFSDLKSEKGTE